jgi:hypothetical protein
LAVGQAFVSIYHEDKLEDVPEWDFAIVIVVFTVNGMIWVEVFPPV